MLFRRLSAQRCICTLVLVGALVATHQVLNAPKHTESTSTPAEPTPEAVQPWKMRIDLGNLWGKENLGMFSNCPEVLPLEPVPRQQVLTEPVDKRVSVISARAEANGLKMTELVRHAPGWTVFENVYMAGGTLFIITDDSSAWPGIRMMTSTGLRAENTPENIASREPTDRDMQFITFEDAERRWGERVWPVRGLTYLINDPGQFISHYYHFVAETWMGLWRMHSSLDSNITFTGETTLEPPARVIFAHCQENEWRDYSTFNQYFMHSVFPSMSIETQRDWEGRAMMTQATTPGTGKVFRFERLIIADRSASFRGEICPSRNQRIVAEAWEATRSESSKFWWEPVRRSVLRFAGVDKETIDMNVVWAREWNGISNGDEVPTNRQVDVARSASRRMPIVITYVVRSGNRRAMRMEDHEVLVTELTNLCYKRSWELNVVQAEKLTKDEQIQLAARTTVMLGIHGNGLTHLIWMPLTPLSTVIEIFYPGGFAKDYEWTARMLGMRHYGIHNDTYFTHPNDPRYANYPDGFHDNQIPAHGPTIARLIEDRVDGRLP